MGEVVNRPTDEPYFIEVCDNGCTHCGEGQTWTVIGPDGPVEQLAAYDAYADEEEACDVAEALNEAYWRGKQSVKRKRSTS